MMKKLTLMVLAVACGAALAWVATSLQREEKLVGNSDPQLSEMESFNEARVVSLNTTDFATQEESRISDRFPDIELLDHRGRNVRFYSDLVQDRCVCVIYFYTRCTGSCPGTTRLVKKLRKDLADEFSNDELVFISLTLEPDVDTPEELQDYMRGNGIEDDPSLPDWVYATGDFEEIDALRKSLGVYDLDPIIDADKTEHAALLTFGNDRTDRWAALPVGMDFEQLKIAMTRIMGENPRQRYSDVVQYREQMLEQFEKSRAHLADSNSPSGEEQAGGRSAQDFSKGNSELNSNGEGLEDTFTLRTAAPS
jgi:protein SCO1/2